MTAAASMLSRTNKKCYTRAEPKSVAHLRGAVLQGSHCFRLLLACICGYATPENARLFSSYQVQGVSEELDVVVVQGGDSGGNWGRDDVGGIKSAAQANF